MILEFTDIRLGAYCRDRANCERVATGYPRYGYKGKKLERHVLSRILFRLHRYYSKSKWSSALQSA